MAIYGKNFIFQQHLVSQLGTRPSTWSGAEPNPRSTPPPRSSRRTPGPSTPPRRRGSPFPNSPPHTPPTPPRRTAPETSPRRSAPQPSPPRQQSTRKGYYDPEQVGRTRRDSLGIFLLPSTATEREIRVQYRRLARKYHPDKYHLTLNTVSSEMTELEAQVHFQLISYAYESLST